MKSFSRVRFLATPWTVAYQAPLSMGFSRQEYCSVLPNMPANVENSAVATGLENISFHPNPKKGNAKECSNYCTIALISHPSKVMIKILQARLQRWGELWTYRCSAGFKSGWGARDQIVNICWIIEKAREFQRNIYFYIIEYAKAFDCVDHKKL